MNQKTSPPAIAVIGIDCWYPGAQSPRELWENILAKRRQFRRTPDQRLPLSAYYNSDPKVPDKTYANRMAVIDGFQFDWAGKRIPRSTFESTDIVHWLALEVCQKALLDAGYTRDSLPSQKTGVVVGNTLTGEITRAVFLRLRWPYMRRALRAAAENKLEPKILSDLENRMEGYLKSVLPGITQDSLAGFLSNTIAGRICNFFDFKGCGYTVDGACSSSLIALATAAQALVNEDLDLALAGGVDISLDPLEMVGFAKTQALTSKEMTVYDRRASGFLPGEGCGFVVLKRLADARADGNYIYAVLRGWGLSSDGAGVGITAPSGSGQAIALRRAYQLAGYSPRDLAFIEGHGTGTKVGDIAELKGIALAMGTDGEVKPRSCGVTSLKSLIGHTKAAAGIGGFIKAVMAVNRRVLPPTAGCKEPNDEFENSARCLYPILQGECHNPNETLKAGVSAMGFGGSNSHVTLESGDAPSPRLAPTLAERALLVSPQETELFVLSAATVEDLQQQAQALTEIAANLSLGELVDLAAHLVSQLDTKLPIRGTLIAGTPEQLVNNLNLLDKMLNETPPTEGEVVVNPEKTLWIGNAVGQCRIGFLFPGQGSQKLNMAGVLVKRYDWAGELVNNTDTWLGELGIEPVSPLIYRSLERAANQELIHEWKTSLAQTQVAQPAICLASLIWMGYLERLGIKPRVVGGHSLGELTAFHAAGAFDQKALLCLAGIRGRAMSAHTSETGVMASLACSQEQTSELLQRVQGNVVIANINSPKQVVISGDKASVEKVIKLAQDEDIQTRLLPVSNAFHSKFVEAAAEELRTQAPVPERLGQTQVRLVSSVNGTKVEAGMQLREHFGEQVTAQVDFVSLVKSMSSECDLLLEVGPGRVLSGLVNSINEGSRPTCLPVEAKPGQDKDINTVLASIFVNGGVINWSVLYENRLVKPFVDPSDRIFIENPCERPFPEVNGSLLPIDTTSGKWSNFQLSDTAKIPPQQLADYLAQRGKFIEQVILADLQTLPDSLPTGNGNGATPVDNGQKQVEPVTPPVSRNRDNVESILINLIAQETGFPPETITLESRLLDDLNLESIKAGEIIAAVATECGVAGKIDPSAWTNSTLAKIVAAIREVMEDETPEQIANSTPKTEKIEAILSRQENWVRNFIIQYVPEEIPLVQPVAESWVGDKVLIVCEPTEVDLAEAMANLLSSYGCGVETVSFGEAREQSSLPGAEFTHLIALLPRTPSPEKDRLSVLVERLQAIATPPERKEEGKPTSIVYIQFGGGYFGTHAPIADIEQCCTNAFAASLHLERSDVKVRVIDFDPAVVPTVLAERAIAEMVTADSYIAVGYNAQMIRQIPRPFVQEPAEYESRAIAWSSEDIILVTGGAKGITSECALALAAETGVKMALVGSSPPPNLGASNEINHTLERFNSKGLTARYYQCNIADSEAVNTLIQRVHQEMGQITGVIHGAGINKPRMVDKVSTQDAVAEISPKLQGAINLCQALQDHPLKLFVGFSSQAGISGLPRNAWYSFSNEAMTQLLRRFQAEHPATSVICIAYGLWEEKGMGVNTGGHRYMVTQGYGAISIDEGVRRFVELVNKNPGDTQIAVIARLNNKISNTWRPLSSFSTIPNTLRFLENVVHFYPGVQAVSHVHLNLERDFYLKDHIYKGTYLFPTVFGLEAMAQVVAYVTGEDNFEAVRIDNINLKQAITVNPEQGTTIEIHVEVLEKEFPEELRLVKAGIRTAQTGFSMDHFSATFVLGIETEAPQETVEFPETPLDIRPQEDLYDSLLFQGLLFQRLKQFYLLKTHYGVFSVERQSQENQTETNRWILGDPYYRDALLQGGQPTIPKDLSLPIGIESWQIYKPKQEDGLFLTTSVIHHCQDQVYYTTVFAVDQEGKIVEKLNGYRLRILEHIEDNPTAEELANPNHRDEQILQKKLETISRSFGVKAPEVSIVNTPELHQLPTIERHQQEQQLLQQTVNKLINNDSEPCQNVKIKWLASGKPVLEFPSS